VAGYRPWPLSFSARRNRVYFSMSSLCRARILTPALWTVRPNWKEEEDLATTARNLIGTVEGGS